MNHLVLIFDSVYYYTGLVIVWVAVVGLVLFSIHLIVKVLVKVWIIKMFIELHKLPNYLFKAWHKTPEQVAEIKKFYRRNKLHKKCHLRVFFGIFWKVMELNHKQNEKHNYT